MTNFTVNPAVQYEIIDDPDVQDNVLIKGVSANEQGPGTVTMDLGSVSRAGAAEKFNEFLRRMDYEIQIRTEAKTKMRPIYNKLMNITE